MTTPNNETREMDLLDRADRVERDLTGAPHQLLQAALAGIPAGMPYEVRLAAMEQLVHKLEEARAYDRIDPLQMTEVVRKQDYDVVVNIRFDAPVYRIQVLPDGRIVASTGNGLFMATEGTDGAWSCERLAPTVPSTTCFQALADGRIVAGDYFGRLHILSKDTAGKWSTEVLAGPRGAILCLQVLPDGRIVSGGEDKTLRIWSKDSAGQWSSEVLEGHMGPVYCLQVCPDGVIVSGSLSGRLYIWNKDSSGIWHGEVLNDYRGAVSCLQALPDGRIVSGGEDKTLRIWSKDSAGQWSSEVLEGHRGPVFCLQVRPDGVIVSGSLDGTLRIWNKDSSAIWHSEVLEDHRGAVFCLQALPDGRIVSGGADETVSIWDGKELAAPTATEQSAQNGSTAVDQVKTGTFNWDQISLDQMAKLACVIGSGSYVADYGDGMRAEQGPGDFKLSDFPAPESLFTRDLANHALDALAGANANDWMDYQVRDVAPVLSSLLDGAGKDVAPSTWTSADVELLRSAFGDRRYIVMLSTGGWIVSHTALGPVDDRNLFDSGYWMTREQAMKVSDRYAADPRFMQFKRHDDMPISRACVVDMLKVLETAIKQSKLTHRDDVCSPSDYVSGKVRVLSHLVLGNLDHLIEANQ